MLELNVGHIICDLRHLHSVCLLCQNDLLEEMANELLLLLLLLSPKAVFK